MREIWDQNRSATSPAKEIPSAPEGKNSLLSKKRYVKLSDRSKKGETEPPEDATKDMSYNR